MEILKKFFLFFLSFIMLFTLLAFPGYAENDFSIDCRACILVDINSGSVLYEQNADAKMYPASITKIMTALVTAERANIEDMVTVSADVINNLDPDGSAVGLKIGEQLTVEQLLYCMLIPSGNDAATVLAEHVGGTVNAFVDMMNAKAAELGADHTHFCNPHGMHSDDHYTTARDLYLITRAFLQSDLLSKICNTVSYVLPATNKSGERILNTTNYLISGVTTGKYLYSYARGVKTGSTTPAGYCLVSTAEKKGMYLAGIVLGCEKKADTGEIKSFSEMKRLFEYGFNYFSYRTLVEDRTPVVEVPVTMSEEVSSVVAVTQGAVSALLGKDFDDETVVITPWLYSESLQAPVVKGQVLGEADISYQGVSYGRVKLVAMNGVEKSDVLYEIDRLGEELKQPKYIALLGGVVLAVILVVAFVLYARHRKKKKNNGKVRYLL